MNLVDEAKIDCHVHVFDPARFPYAADTPYRPGEHETATADSLEQLMRVHGVRHALLVGPNSGYGEDNRCMLDAIARGQGRFKGIAVVPEDISREGLRELKAGGVVGVACNVAYHGIDYYLGIGPLCKRLEAEGLLLQMQVEGAQLLRMLPVLESTGVHVLVDHAGRPQVAEGVGQAGFGALLALGRAGRATVKLSGYAKYSRAPHPHADVRPYVQRLLDAFTPERCVWASDWPFLRAPTRIDYGPVLALAGELMPDARVRRQVFWDTPAKLLGFGPTP